LKKPLETSNDLLRGTFLAFRRHVTYVIVTAVSSGSTILASRN
jgi:hypothetical protein